MIDFLNAMPLAGLMLVVALGFTLGRLTWRGMSIGPAGGTLGIALAFGMLGLDSGAGENLAGANISVGQFGFALFIYSVGFEAGPRFFSSIMGGPGWRFVLVGSTVNVLALGCAVVLGRLFELGEGITAGMLAGSLTSAPTYAAAAELSSDVSGLAVSFALTYPIGLVGLVMMIQFLPRFMGDDLAKESADKIDRTKQKARPELTRAFDVQQEEVMGKSLRELDLTHRTGCYVTLVHRGSLVFVPDADTELQKNDHVLVKGRFDELQVFADVVGREVYDEEMRNQMPAPRRLVVRAKESINKSLSELDLARRYHCLVTGIIRSGIPIEPTSDTCLERGDIVEVVGKRGHVKQLAAIMGRYEKPSHETDIAVYAGGILIGLIIGSQRLNLGGVPFTLGMAGGLLLAGIVLGRYRTIGPITTTVPPAARQLVRDLGILLFVAETGMLAGHQDLSRFHGVVAPTLAAAAITTLLSVLVAALVARRIMRLRPVDTWGSIGGGMTSSASLVALRRAAESNEPALSYAAAYAVASVLVTIAGQLVILFV